MQTMLAFSLFAAARALADVHELITQFCRVMTHALARRAQVLIELDFSRASFKTESRIVLRFPRLCDYFFFFLVHGHPDQRQLIYDGLLFLEFAMLSQFRERRFQLTLDRFE